MEEHLVEALKQETPKGTSAVMAGWLDDHSVGLELDFNDGT